MTRRKIVQLVGPRLLALRDAVVQQLGGLPAD
jgi:hypothetical protein